MSNIAIVEKYPTNFKFESLFPFEFKKYALVQEKLDKILKKDVTLDIDKLKEEHDFIILIGKEPCKIVADIRSVTEMQGYLVDKKYLALMNPMAVKLRPSNRNAFEKAINDIVSTINNDGVVVRSDLELLGLQDEKLIIQYLSHLESAVNSKEVRIIAMDTETSSLYPRDGYVLGICIATAENIGRYLDTNYITEEAVEILQRIINKVIVVFHNAKFDIKMLNYHFGLTFPNWEDTMIEHYVLDESVGSHGLKELAIKHTDLGDYDRELEEWKTNYCKTYKVKVSEFTYDLIPFEVMTPYACTDPIATLRLHNKFYPLILENSKLFEIYTNLLKKGSWFLNQVEENGIPVDKEYLNSSILEINEEVAKLTEELYKYEEVKRVEKDKGVLFNVNSPAHVTYLFFTVLNLPIIKLTDTGNASADAEVLDQLAKDYPVAKTINDIKKLKKVRSTYLEKMLQGIDHDNRLRTYFNLTTTTSGRLSSSGKINAQQLPREDKRPKKAIKARPGFKIASQDLKTAEMYVASVLSGDKNLQKVFVTGVDYHGFMAVTKFGLKCSENEVKNLYPDLRQDAKTISFEILYKLNYREPVLQNFPKLKAWLKQQEEFIKSNGYIYSIFGRKRRVADVFSPNKEEAQHMVRSAINFLVQSVSSDINLIAGIKMLEWIIANGYREDMIIFGLVHDSILAEVREDLLPTYFAKLKEFTQEDLGCSIPGSPIGVDQEAGDDYASVTAFRY